MNLTTHLHPVSGLRMGGAIHLSDKFIHISMERSSGAYSSEAVPTILEKIVNKLIQKPSERLVKSNI